MKRLLLFLTSVLGITGLFNANAQCPSGQADVQIGVETDSWGYELYWELVPTGNACGGGTAVFTGGNTNVNCSGGGAKTATAGDPGAYPNNTLTTENIGCQNIGTVFDIIAVDDWGDGGTTFHVSIDGSEVYSFSAGGANDLFTFTVTVPANNLALDSAFYFYNAYAPSLSDVPYRQMPFLRPGARVANPGTADQTSVVVGMAISDGANTTSLQSQVASTITSGTTDTLFWTSTIYSTSPNTNYTITYNVTSTAVDEVPTNNTASKAINITDTVYARDGWGLGYALNGTSYSLTGGYGYGHYFEIYTTDTAKSVTCFLFSDANISLTSNPSVIQAEILDAATQTSIAVSAPYATTTTDFSQVGNYIPVTLNFPANTILNPGNMYMVVVSDISGNPDNTRFLATSQISDTDFPSILYDASSSTYFITDVYPWVRLNTGMSACDPANQVDVVVNDISCNGLSDGEMMVSVAGATSTTVTWSTGATTPAISGLAAGTYAVTVVYDLSGETCLFVDDNTIVEPSALTVTTSSTLDQCSLGNGTASTSVSGGTAPYAYAWSNNGTTATISGLSGGSYMVTVVDANGCESSASVSVGATPGVIVATTATDASGCGASDGTASVLSPTGIAYAHLWSNGATSPMITGLPPAAYGVTVTDTGTGCTGEGVALVGQNSVTITVATTVSDVSCNGGSDGAAVAMASGGTAPYVYGWFNMMTGSTVTGLPADVYGVQATDANGCAGFAIVTITEPTAITASMTVTDVSCNGAADGSAMVAAMGGTPAYMYTWSNGSTTSSASNLSAGSVSVTITDANGCTMTKTGMVNEPTAVVATINATDITCNGAGDGTATVTASGGTGSGYTYMWSNNSTSMNVSNLSAGTYSVTVTDANGCTGTATATISEPAALAVSGSVTDATDQPVGVIDIAVTGGTMPYTYNWSNGANTEDLTGLAQGTYTVTVTDANGCTTTASYTVNGTVATFNVAGANTVVVYPNPNNGIFTVSMKNIVNDIYTFKVTNMLGQVVAMERQSLSGDASTTFDLSGLDKGVYFLTVGNSQNEKTFKVTIK